jgi:hypothetical protein
MQSVFPKGLLDFMPSQLLLDYFPLSVLPISDSTVRRFNIQASALSVFICVNLPALPAQWNAFEVIFHQGGMPRQLLFHRGVAISSIPASQPLSFPCSSVKIRGKDLVPVRLPREIYDSNIVVYLTGVVIF